MADFYEDDEPVADVVGAFERGKKGKTAPPNKINIRPSRFLDTATTSTFGTRKVSRLTAPAAKPDTGSNTYGVARS